MSRGTEVELVGGTANRGQVVRVGDTVRRPERPSSPAVHALLEHLAGIGFDGAPRFLGIDESGREVLSFIPGETVLPPYPAWSMTDAALTSVARLLYRYHEAVAGFDPSGHEWVEPVPAAYAGKLVSHNDPNLDNVVFRDGEAVALIDFDLVKPATRTDELLNVMLWWAPLMDPVDRDPVQADAGAPKRCRLIADAYGLSATDRTRLVEVGRIRNQRAWYLMKHRAETMGGGWQRMWDEGVGDVIRRRSAWFDQQADLIHQALLG